jgi:hypothetical protein
MWPTPTDWTWNVPTSQVPVSWPAIKIEYSSDGTFRIVQDTPTPVQKAMRAYERAESRCIACGKGYVCPWHRRMREVLESRGLWA